MRRLMTKRFLAAYGIAAALVGTGAFLWIRQDAPAVRYRTAAATLGTVTQTVSLSGNLTPVGETDLNFGSSGRVSAVSAAVGQSVTAGQVLAALDTSALQGSLTVAQANLQSAQARLSLDQAGPTPQNLASAQAQVSSANAQLQNNETSLADTEAVNAQSMTQAHNALDQADSQWNTDNCTSPPSTPTCQTDMNNVDTATSNLQATTVKVQQGNDQAQGQVSAARVSLQNAQAALSALEQGTASQQIQMDENQVQIDQVNVNTAQTALDQATLTAPVSGVVAQVNIIAGQQVSGGSTGSSSNNSSGASSSSSSSSAAAVTMLTPGAFQVSGDVSDALVGELTVGQRAQVVVAGSSEAITGSVSQIAEEATVTSGVATFPVTVTLDGDNATLRAGMSASVGVIVNQVVQVLTVPTSAVHTTAAGSTVNVLVNGQSQARTVQVGATDAIRTQILSGINPGDQVVIATLSSTVPSNTSAGGLFGGGGFGGGGRGGGGRGGGTGG